MENQTKNEGVREVSDVDVFLYLCWLYGFDDADESNLDELPALALSHSRVLREYALLNPEDADFVVPGDDVETCRRYFATHRAEIEAEKKSYPFV